MFFKDGRTLRRGAALVQGIFPTETHGESKEVSQTSLFGGFIVSGHPRYVHGFMKWNFQESQNIIIFYLGSRDSRFVAFFTANDHGQLVTAHMSHEKKKIGDFLLYWLVV